MLSGGAAFAIRVNQQMSSVQASSSSSPSSATMIASPWHAMADKGHEETKSNILSEKSIQQVIKKVSVYIKQLLENEAASQRNDDNDEERVQYLITKITHKLSQFHSAERHFHRYSVAKELSKHIENVMKHQHDSVQQLSSAVPHVVHPSVLSELEQLIAQTFKTHQHKIGVQKRSSASSSSISSASSHASTKQKGLIVPMHEKDYDIKDEDDENGEDDDSIAYEEDEDKEDDVSDDERDTRFVNAHDDKEVNQLDAQPRGTTEIISFEDDDNNDNPNDNNATQSAFESQFSPSRPSTSHSSTSFFGMFGPMPTYDSIRPLCQQLMGVSSSRKQHSRSDLRDHNSSSSSIHRRVSSPQPTQAQLKRSAMDGLLEFLPGDLLASVEWQLVRDAVVSVLDDSDSEIAKKALSCAKALAEHAKGTSQVGELYVSILQKLIQHFVCHRQWYKVREKIQLGASLSEDGESNPESSTVSNPRSSKSKLKPAPSTTSTLSSSLSSSGTALSLAGLRFSHMLSIHRLLLSICHEMPSYWLYFPDELVTDILLRTLHYLSLSAAYLQNSPEMEKPRDVKVAKSKIKQKPPIRSNSSSSATSDLYYTPCHFFAVLEPSALWFKKWFIVTPIRLQIISLFKTSAAPKSTTTFHTLIPDLLTVCQTFNASLLTLSSYNNLPKKGAGVSHSISSPAPLSDQIPASRNVLHADPTYPLSLKAITSTDFEYYYAAHSFAMLSTFMQFHSVRLQLCRAVSPSSPSLLPSATPSTFLNIVVTTLATFADLALEHRGAPTAQSPGVSVISSHTASLRYTLIAILEQFLCTVLDSAYQHPDEFFSLDATMLHNLIRPLAKYLCCPFVNHYIVRCLESEHDETGPNRSLAPVLFPFTCLYPPQCLPSFSYADSRERLHTQPQIRSDLPPLAPAISSFSSTGPISAVDDNSDEDHGHPTVFNSHSSQDLLTKSQRRRRREKKRKMMQAQVGKASTKVSKSSALSVPSTAGNSVASSPTKISPSPRSSLPSAASTPSSSAIVKAELFDQFQTFDETQYWQSLERCWTGESFPLLPRIVHTVLIIFRRAMFATDSLPHLITQKQVLEGPFSQTLRVISAAQSAELGPNLTGTSGGVKLAFAETDLLSSSDTRKSSSMFHPFSDSSTFPVSAHLPPARVEKLPNFYVSDEVDGGALQRAVILVVKSIIADECIRPYLQRSSQTSKRTLFAQDTHRPSQALLVSLEIIGKLLASHGGLLLCTSLHIHHVIGGCIRVIQKRLTETSPPVVSHRNELLALLLDMFINCLHTAYGGQVLIACGIHEMCLLRFYDRYQFSLATIHCEFGDASNVSELAELSALPSTIPVRNGRCQCASCRQLPSFLKEIPPVTIASCTLHIHDYQVMWSHIAQHSGLHRFLQQQLWHQRLFQQFSSLLIDESDSFSWAINSHSKQSDFYDRTYPELVRPMYELLALYLSSPSSVESLLVGGYPAAQMAEIIHAILTKFVLLQQDADDQPDYLPQYVCAVDAQTMGLRFVYALALSPSYRVYLQDQFRLNDVLKSLLQHYTIENDAEEVTIIQDPVTALIQAILALYSLPLVAAGVKDAAISFERGSSWRSSSADKYEYARSSLINQAKATVPSLLLSFPSVHAGAASSSQSPSSAAAAALHLHCQTTLSKSLSLLHSLQYEVQADRSATAIAKSPLTLPHVVAQALHYYRLILNLYSTTTASIQPADDEDADIEASSAVQITSQQLQHLKLDNHDLETAHAHVPSVAGLQTPTAQIDNALAFVAARYVPYCLPDIVAYLTRTKARRFSIEDRRVEATNVVDWFAVLCLILSPPEAPEIATDGTEEVFYDETSTANGSGSTSSTVASAAVFQAAEQIYSKWCGSSHLAFEASLYSSRLPFASACLSPMLIHLTTHIVELELPTLYNSFRSVHVSLAHTLPLTLGMDYLIYIMCCICKEMEMEFRKCIGGILPSNDAFTFLYELTLPNLDLVRHWPWMHDTLMPKYRNTVFQQLLAVYRSCSLSLPTSRTTSATSATDGSQLSQFDTSLLASIISSLE